MSSLTTSPHTCAVLLPTFNSARYLAEAMESILDQTHADLRLYILDGGSEDPSLDIAKAYAKRDPRIVVQSYPGVHPTERLDRLIPELDCRFFAIQHSDDISYRTRIERQLRAFDDDPRLAVCSALSRSFWHERSAIPPSEGVVIHPKPAGHEMIMMQLPFWHVMHCPTLMFRKEMTDRVGLRFTNDFKFGNDWWMTVTHIRTLRYHNIQEELSAYRMHSFSDGPTNRSLVKAEVDRIRERALSFFGFTATPAEIALHNRINLFSDGELNISTVEELSGIAYWLRSLRRQNDDLNVFNRPLFAELTETLLRAAVEIARNQGLKPVER